MAHDLERLKQRIPLLDYLERHNWRPCRAGTQQELVGLCPLHQETRPSFYVNAHKNLFYCHGCGRGGDLIRFVQLFRNLPFRQSVAHLEQELTPMPAAQLLEHTTVFYRLQRHRHSEAIRYLEHGGLHDPAVIEELGIGYAPGGNLRHHLAALGYSFDLLLDMGLINQQGRDAFCRRVIFPCRQHGRVVNLYGRSIGAAFPHRLLPRSKGGLFAWESVRSFSGVILVEGLFDLAILWQAGFRNTTCAIGDLYKKSHWPVDGSTFYQLHLLFDKHFDEQVELVDSIAERIQLLGGISIAMAHDVAEMTRIERPPRGREAGPVQLSRLLDAHQVIIGQVRKLAHRVGELGDDGTNDLVVSEILRRNELQTWFLSEHLVDAPLVHEEPVHAK